MSSWPCLLRVECDYVRFFLNETHAAWCLIFYRTYNCQSGLVQSVSKKRRTSYTWSVKSWLNRIDYQLRSWVLLLDFIGFWNWSSFDDWLSKNNQPRSDIEEVHWRSICVIIRPKDIIALIAIPCSTAELYVLSFH